MLLKLWMAGGTAALSLGLAGILPWAVDDPKPEEPGTATIEVAARDADGPKGQGEDDAAVPLREVYVVLRQLRGERLEERPKELTERAVVLYRDGLKAYEAGDLDRAKALGVASRELARAVELARKAQQSEKPDPDLPAPPKAKLTLRAHVGGQAVTLFPPALPADGPSGDAPKLVVGSPKGVYRVETKTQTIKTPDGKEHTIVLAAPKAEVRAEIKADGKAEPKREVYVKKLDELNPDVLKLYTRQKAEGQQAEALNALAKVYATAAPDDSARARAVLKRAYDRVREAREKAKGDDAKFYLDAARDLYNAARRDAEAGRFERAAELARAAEALTLVPQHLGAVRDAAGKGSKSKEERREEVRIFRRDAGDAKGGEAKAQERVEVRVLTPDSKEAQKLLEQLKEKAKESKPKKGSDDQGRRDDAKEAEGRAAAEDRAPVGIGVALRFEDGKVVVNSVLPGGPAAEDGSIQEGDVIVGVKGEGDATTEFAGKESQEVVEALRGKPGTSVRVVVRREGSDEPKVVELKRRKLAVPQDATKPADADEKPKGTTLLPLPGGGNLTEVRPRDLKEFKIQIEPKTLPGVKIEPKAGKVYRFELAPQKPGSGEANDGQAKRFEYRLVPGGQADKPKNGADDLPPPLDE